jgi:hypothetical protein
MPSPVYARFCAVGKNSGTPIVTVVFIGGWAARQYHADVASADLTLIDP